MGLTAVRALGHQQGNLRGGNATTHPVAPLSIVHGEVVDALGFNAGLGAFGPGTRANATVGRAVRLVLLHVAGARPGPGDASTQGQPSKYTYCVAENSAESPWESYHRSVGVEAPSAVTVHCGENPHNFHDMESDRIERILDKAASAMATFGVNNACISGGEWFIGLCPEHAAVADGDGCESALGTSVPLLRTLTRCVLASAACAASCRLSCAQVLQVLVGCPQDFQVLQETW